MGRVVALFSGGMDSTTLAWKLRAEGWELILLSFNTYRRNPREREAAERIASRLGKATLMVFNLEFLRELFDFTEDAKKSIYNAIPDAPNIIIPYKNIIYYSLAAHIAAQTDAEALAGGHTLEDQTGLPDASRPYLDELEALIGRSLPYPRLRILTPLIGLRKADVVGLGHSLGELHCGLCGGCQARMKAFREAGVEDRTLYSESSLNY